MSVTFKNCKRSWIYGKLVAINFKWSNIQESFDAVTSLDIGIQIISKLRNCSRFSELLLHHHHRFMRVIRLLVVVSTDLIIHPQMFIEWYHQFWVLWKLLINDIWVVLVKVSFRVRKFIWVVYLTNSTENTQLNVKPPR